MKIKKSYKIAIIVLGFLMAAPVCKAQNYGERSSAGLGLFYDLQLRNNMKTGTVPSNFGATAMIEIPVTYVWTARVFANVYGLTKHENYDRCAMAGADIKFNLNNTIAGERRRGNVYGLVGAGISYSVDGTDGIGMCVNFGIGYSIWLAKRINLYTESNFSMIGNTNILSGSIALGCLISL